MKHPINKSLLTNIVAIGTIVAGYFLPEPVGAIVLSMGLFALSGAITNWLAVHMLFEKVPFLYGSGVIPNHFAEFKAEIRKLVMSQFFNYATIQQSFSDGTLIKELFDSDHLIKQIDFDKAYESFINALLGSPIGSMIDMFGGQKILDNLKEPVIKSMKRTIEDIISEDIVNKTFVDHQHIGQTLFDTIDIIVTDRLNELTPAMVKTIVSDMIAKHLGWLVVWGGVFGAMIGGVVGVFS